MASDLQHGPVTDLTELITGLAPERQPGVYVFSSVAADTPIDIADHAMILRESEGLTLISEENRARALGLPAGFRSAWITLTLRSDLAAVGLTAAVSAALAETSISCNVVAGVCHNHLFVPADDAEPAMTELLNLQKNSSTVKDS